jgi:hypothetical protein
VESEWLILATQRKERYAFMKHPMQPMQPMEKDKDGVMRFKQNAIVRRLLDFGQEHGLGLNELACENFPPEDRMQLAQLLGYSLSGYGELDYVDDHSYVDAEKSARIAAGQRGA